ncbi:MAG: hypothetical protein NVS3B17_18000 [Vulcanimicrobiaceae bacterium]
MLTARVAIGFGCTSRATAQDIVALIARECGELRPGTVLATLDRRDAIARAVARELALDVVTFDAERLARVRGTTVTSPRALASVGTPSVAEAAALAALGDAARLVVTRRTGHRCTCARAEMR